MFLFCPELPFKVHSYFLLTPLQWDWAWKILLRSNIYTRNPLTEYSSSYYFFFKWIKTLKLHANYTPDLANKKNSDLTHRNVYIYVNNSISHFGTSLKNQLKKNEKGCIKWNIRTFRLKLCNNQIKKSRKNFICTFYTICPVFYWSSLFFWQAKINK